ncbi:MAG: RluA family pseudouridine synthase [Candidatus Nitrospinota bacterium M3_3B_026]
MIVGAESAGQRIDRFLAGAGLSLTRSRAQKLIADGFVKRNGETVHSASEKVREADEIEVFIPPPAPPEKAVPEDIPLDVVYEDGDVIVVNKPPGMVVSPAAGHRGGTLVNALLAHCGGLSSVGGAARPGIVHRLDKDTSGVIIAAKNDKASLSLSSQLKERTMSRTYVAVVKGAPREDEGVIDTLIGRHPRDRKKMATLKEGGRRAVSRYRVAQRLSGASVVEVSLMTGRTHQIRVHMLHINCPVAGDPVYSRGKNRLPIKRQALHAWKIRFVHPRTGKEVELRSPIPADMESLIRALGGDPSPYLGGGEG